jgi:hypothetical protein
MSLNIVPLLLSALEALVGPVVGEDAVHQPDAPRLVEVGDLTVEDPAAVRDPVS